MRLFHLLWLCILLLNVDVSSQERQVTCSNRRPEHVSSWDVRSWQQYFLDDTTRYWCERGYQRTGGATRATCTRNGWMPNPLCEAITCSVPAIENGRVPGAIKEYKLSDVLHYECDRGFKHTERPSTCIKLGIRAEWSPTPLCEPNAAIKCKLPTIEGTRYEPADRNLFSPGETLTVLCARTSWISFLQESPIVTTCQEDGEWSIRPTCQAVRCSNRRPDHVSSWDVRSWQRYFLDDTTRYWCERGYQRTGGATRATCTRNGWMPNPLCEEPVGCGTPPSLEHGDIKYSGKANYSHNESVEYQCQSYYTMEGEPFRTCISGNWTGQMRCIEPCIVNEDDHKRHNIALKSDDGKYFAHDEIMEYRCARGIPVGSVAMRQRCNSGVILLPSCQ